MLSNQRAGVLLPSEVPTRFIQRRRANSAVRRSLRCAELLRTSLISDWLATKHAQAQALLTPGAYTIEPVRPAQLQLAPKADKAAV